MAYPCQFHTSHVLVGADSTTQYCAFFLTLIPAAYFTVCRMELVVPKVGRFFTGLNVYSAFPGTPPLSPYTAIVPWFGPLIHVNATLISVMVALALGVKAHACIHSPCWESEPEMVQPASLW